MRTEFARDAGVAHERSLAAPCLARRLDQVATLLRTARRTGRLPDIGEIGRPPTRPLVRAAWDTAVGTGVLSHMDRGQSADWSGWFDLVGFFALSATNEWQLWGRLAAISDSPGPISDTLASELVLTVADLRAANAVTTLTAAQIEAHSRDMGAPPDYLLIFDRDGGTAAQIAASVAKRSVCQPLIVDGRPYGVSATS